MPTSDRRIAIVQHIYDATKLGDFKAAAAYCSDEIVILEDDALPWGGRYVGRDGLAEFVERLVGAIDPVLKPEQIFRAGDHVVQYGRNQGTVRHNLVAFDIPECHVWTFRDDTVVEARFFSDSRAMFAALEAPSGSAGSRS